MTPCKFQENSSQSTEKFPEIQHYIWEIPRESPLRLSRNSQKLFTSLRKFPENSPEPSEKFQWISHEHTKKFPEILN